MKFTSFIVHKSLPLTSNVRVYLVRCETMLLIQFGDVNAFEPGVFLMLKKRKKKRKRTWGGGFTSVHEGEFHAVWFSTHCTLFNVPAMKGSVWTANCEAPNVNVRLRRSARLGVSVFAVAEVSSIMTTWPVPSSDDGLWESFSYRHECLYKTSCRKCCSCPVGNKELSLAENAQQQIKWLLPQRVTHLILRFMWTKFPNYIRAAAGGGLRVLTSVWGQSLGRQTEVL